MALSLRACILLLKEHHLLKSAAIQTTEDVDMTGIAYDSRKVGMKSLLDSIKGYFPSPDISKAKVAIEDRKSTRLNSSH